MTDTLTRVRTMASNYRTIALSGKYPKALRSRAIDAAWRSTVKEHPELAAYEAEYRRVTAGIEAKSAMCPSCGCDGEHIESRPISGPSSWCVACRMVCA